MRRLALLAGPTLLASFGAATADAAPVVTPGCQGELCYDTGEWLAERSLALFERPGALRPIGTIRRGARVTALGGLILTTRIGRAVTTDAGPHLPAEGEGSALVRLPAGTPIRTLFYEGEGIVIAVAPDGRRIGIETGSFRELAPFRAVDWVRLRLPDGRIGWSNARDQFLCSSHIDDEPGQCRGLPATDR